MTVDLRQPDRIVNQRYGDGRDRRHGEREECGARVVLKVIGHERVDERPDIQAPKRGRKRMPT